MRFAWSLILLSLCTNIFSCVHQTEVWTVRRAQDGLIIGYRLGDEEEASILVRKSIKRLADKTCEPDLWEIESDSLKSESRNFSYVVPVENTSYHQGYISSASYGRNDYTPDLTYRGTSTTTTYQTQIYTKTYHWREVIVNCLEYEDED